MRLYEIASEIAAICDGEELPPDLEARLDSLAVDLDAKADACCRLIRENESEAKRFKDEAERLADIADGLASRATRLKAYVHQCLVLAGMRKLDTELFRLSICKNSRPSIRCEGEIPEPYQRMVVSLDSQRAYEDWKNGVPLPAEIEVAQGEHLRIK